MYSLEMGSGGLFWPLPFGSVEASVVDPGEDQSGQQKVVLTEPFNSVTNELAEVTATSCQCLESKGWSH